jgi:hypothetical protein
MAALRPHKFTIGTRDYFLRLPDVYDNGADFTVGSAFGISKVEGDVEIKEEDERITVSDGLKNGRLVRIRVSYKETVAGVIRTKSARLVCPINKAGAGLVAAESKKIHGKEISTVGIPRRRRLG